MPPPDPLCVPLVLPASVHVAADRSDAEGTVLALFDDYQRPLTRYVMSLGLSTADAEDVVQDVFIALFRHLQRDRVNTNLPGWLFQVAHNLGLRHRRRGQRFWTPVTRVDALAQERIDPAADPETQLSDAEQRQQWQRVLQALPDRDRRCVVLRADGLSYRDIAAMLGVSLGAVAKSLTRAFDRFGRCQVRIKQTTPAPPTDDRHD